MRTDQIADVWREPRRKPVGGSVGSQIGASVLAATVVGSALPTERGYTLAFVIAACACGLAAVASLAAPRPSRAPGPVAADLAAG